MSRPKSPRPAWDLTWYVEQEGLIRDAAVAAATARTEMQLTFDPGYLYVVEFDSDVVKVGKTGSPLSRLSQHAKAGLVRRSWVSDHHLNISQTERGLIGFCLHVGELHGGREYFRGLSFETACTFAELVVRRKRLTDERDDVDEAIQIMGSFQVARRMDKDWSDLHADPELLAAHKRRVAKVRRDLVDAGFLSAT